LSYIAFFGARCPIVTHHRSHSTCPGPFQHNRDFAAIGKPSSKGLLLKRKLPRRDNQLYDNTDLRFGEEGRGLVAIPALTAITIIAALPFASLHVAVASFPAPATGADVIGELKAGGAEIMGME